MSVFVLVYFAVVAAGDEPASNSVPVTVDSKSWSATATARRLPAATELPLALEMVQLARQRFSSLRISHQPEPPTLAAAALEITRRTETALEICCEVDPTFRRSPDFGDGKARLELLAAVQEFESLASVQGEEQRFPQPPPLRRAQRTLELVKGGASLVASQLQLGETRGADPAQRSRIAQESKQLEARRDRLAKRLNHVVTNRELDLSPILVTEAEQLASDVLSLVQRAWGLVGSADQWELSRRGPQIDEILSKNDELLETLKARVAVAPIGEPHADELRSLLIRKAALLREATSNLGIAIHLHLETGPDAGVVKLLEDSVQVELELCDMPEERQRVCSHYVRLAAELAEAAEAEWQSGRMPAHRLTELKLHLLDTRILLLREKKRDKMRNDTAGRSPSN